VAGLGVRVREPAEHGQTAGDGVAAGREPLVRQSLPGREHGHVVVRQVAAQRGGRLVRVAAGGGDDDERAAGALARGGPVGGGVAAGAGQRGQQGRADAGGPDDVDLAAGRDEGDGARDGGVGEEDGQQSGDVHGFLPGCRRRGAVSTRTPDPADPGLQASTLRATTDTLTLTAAPLLT